MEYSGKEGQALRRDKRNKVLRLLKWIRELMLQKQHRRHLRSAAAINDV